LLFLTFIFINSKSQPKAMFRIAHTYKQNPDLEFILGKLNDLSGMQSFVYGGFPRDILRGDTFHDIDVAVPCHEVAVAFIKNLEESRRMIQLETRTTKDHLEYQCFTMEIQTPMTHRLKVDMTYSHATSFGCDSLKKCDFTVNNLRFNRNGDISTRIKAYQIGLKISETEWTARCIRDCIEGKLVWMIPDRFSKSMGATEASRTAFMEKMNMRLEKMLNKGFVLTEKLEEQHLTSFRLVNVSAVSTGSNEPSDQ
jgi:hypothetical protein